MNSEQINVVLTKELKDKVEELAKKMNISRNALVRIALFEYIERNK